MSLSFNVRRACARVAGVLAVLWIAGVFAASAAYGGLCLLTGRKQATIFAVSAPFLLFFYRNSAC